MKKIFIVAVVLSICNISFGQKTGSVDYNTILTKMPAYKTAESDYHQYQKVLEDSMAQQYSTCLDLKTDYQESIARGDYFIGSETEKSALKKIRDLEQTLVYWDENFQAIMDSKNTELMGNVRKVLNAAIAEYAKENSFNLIIYNDSAIYHDQEIIDVTQAICNRMGL